MNIKRTLTSIAIISTMALSGQSYADTAEKDQAKKVSPSTWLNLSESELVAVEKYATDYKTFIYQTPTELTFVTETIKRAEKQGFKRLSEKSNLKPGARFYDVNRDRTISLI
ncbi:MAG: hypothetical protein ACI9O3_001646, partial [Colwellia sp.]